MTPELAESIGRCKNPFVSVSLDAAEPGPHDWLRGVQGSFDLALKGLESLAAAGLKPQIIMTVTKRTKDQVEQVVRLAERSGAGSVKLNAVEPVARGEAMAGRGETLSIRELVELGDWVEKEIAAGTPLRISCYHPAAFRPLGRMFGPSGDGCDSCRILNILGVLSDGSYSLCGIGRTVPDLVFGHASRDRLRDVWERSVVLEDLRSGLPGRLQGVCGKCLMKEACLGCCIAQSYYRTKDLYAPFWYCEEADRLGLFPSTRKRPGC